MTSFARLTPPLFQGHSVAMHDVDSFDAAPSFDQMPFEMSTAVEGVEFWIAAHPGHRTLCVITKTALQRHFAAIGARSDSWVSVFVDNRHEIEEIVRAVCGQRGDVHVVLVNDTAGRLKVVLGRCAVH